MDKTASAYRVACQSAIHFRDAHRDRYGLCGVSLVDVPTTLTTTLGHSVTCRECLADMARTSPILLLEIWQAEILEFAKRVRENSAQHKRPAKFQIELDGAAMTFFELTPRGRKAVR